MEWTKLILEHFVQIIHYIAWPAVALVSLFLFREELGHLMGRIKEYHHGDKHVVFSTKEEQGGSRELSISASASEPQLSPEAKKILSTLWQHQKYHFGDDFSKRWSFRILPNTEVYGTFMLGFAELLKLGLVGWTPKDGQALLIDKGIEYLKSHPEIQQSGDVYKF